MASIKNKIARSRELRAGRKRTCASLAGRSVPRRDFRGPALPSVIPLLARLFAAGRGRAGMIARTRFRRR